MTTKKTDPVFEARVAAVKEALDKVLAEIKQGFEGQALTNAEAALALVTAKLASKGWELPISIETTQPYFKRDILLITEAIVGNPGGAYKVRVYTWKRDDLDIFVYLQPVMKF